MIHPFEHGGVCFLVFFPTFFLVVGEEFAVGFKGGVDGVVGHVEIERGVLLDRLFHGGDGLASDGFGEVDLLAVIFFEPGDVPDGVALAEFGGEVFVSVVGARAADM